jgi:hypothetical protein
MSLLLVLEILGGYVVAGASITWFVFFGWDWLRDMDAQRRMDALIAAQDGYLREERLSMELDYILSLPSAEPWGRWLP